MIIQKFGFKNEKLLVFEATQKSSIVCNYRGRYKHYMDSKFELQIDLPGPALVANSFFKEKKS